MVIKETRNFKSLVPAVLLIILLMGCSGSGQTSEEVVNNGTTTEDTLGLKDYYQNYFTMGVAVAPSSVEGEEAELIKRHFASMTAENVMKMGPIHPERGRYNWSPADKIVDFARKNDLKMRGHALVWHQQAPEWIFLNKNGDWVSKDSLLHRLEEHIISVVSRYKDDIYSWDVVNEAVADDPNTVYRESIWYEIAGKDFVARAFEIARETDPDAELYYNDYNIVRPEKMERTYAFLKELIDKGVPIDGVGIQGHWSIFEPSEQELRNALDRYSSLGLKIQITELDVSIYKWEKENREMKAGETDDFTPELEQKQIEQYKMFFRVFRDYKDVIDGITFWNVSDRHTWLDNYPVPGRKNYPLLFDENLKPKRAYWEVVNFEEEGNRNSL